MCGVLCTRYRPVRPASTDSSIGNAVFTVAMPLAQAAGMEASCKAMGMRTSQ